MSRHRLLVIEKKLWKYNTNQLNREQDSFSSFGVTFNIIIV
jgi:hypothetical protein